MIKNFFISIGFGVLSFIGSILYYFLLPYIALWMTLGVDGGKELIIALAPAPIFVFISLWLFSTGVYFFNNKLIISSQIFIAIAIVYGIVLKFLI